MTPLVLLAKPLYLSVNYARASHSESDVTIDEYIKATVMNVKETNNLKEDSTTNDPQGTVSQNTQTSIELLLNGMKSLMSKVTNVNPNYKDFFFNHYIYFFIFLFHLFNTLLLYITFTLHFLIQYSWEKERY